MGIPWMGTLRIFLMIIYTYSVLVPNAGHINQFRFIHKPKNMKNYAEVKATQGIISWLATYRILIDYAEHARDWEQTIADEYQQRYGDTGLLQMALDYTNELEGYFLELASFNDHQRREFVLKQMRIFESEY